MDDFIDRKALAEGSGALRRVQVQRAEWGLEGYAILDARLQYAMKGPEVGA